MSFEEAYEDDLCPFLPVGSCALVCSLDSCSSGGPFFSIPSFFPVSFYTDIENEGLPTLQHSWAKRQATIIVYIDTMLISAIESFPHIIPTEV